MDVGQVEALVKDDHHSGVHLVKVVMPVHIYGHPVDMDPIVALAEEYGLKIIEDAAEVHGAEYLADRNTPSPKWKKCGSLGDVSAFSFYANKLITTGEGGMVLTNDAQLAEKARSLRNLCFRPEQRFLHTELGHNFRMTNLQAAIGLAQLERMEEIIARKRWMGQAYTERLQGVPGLQLPVEESWAKQVYWMYGIVLDQAMVGMDARAFTDILQRKGVETRPFFLGMHEQPVFRAMGLKLEGHFPVTERIARQGFYLPSGLAITESQIDEVVDAVKEALVGN